MTLIRNFGAIFQNNGSTRFRVWAPSHESLSVELTREYQVSSEPMIRSDDGFFEVTVENCSPGTRYRFRFPSGEARPDPASCFQPEGVHGWSQVIDSTAFKWQAVSWNGIRKSELVIYELHVGCFTNAGTYLAAIERLDELANLGVTAIELMPIAQAAGLRNWGYDGVGIFAPNHAFGTPDELRHLIDAAHQRGIAVLLDVVYNHFGPEGNYWGEYGPYLSDRHSTPWGDAPNFDGKESRPIRDMFIANALYWLDEFRFDGLRIDAAHCTRDETEPHIIAEISSAVAEYRTQTRREIHLIAESNVFDPEMLKSLDSGGLGCDALWCDDFLHSVFAILRPGDHMSSRQYHPHTDFDLILRRGFVFQGSLKSPRRRVLLEESVGGPNVPIESLVCAIQTHDFIGNHPQGRRLHQLTSPNAQKSAAALLLLYPAIPMLFMGEEFAVGSPFFFFADFGDLHLRDALDTGRRLEYPQHDWADVESPSSPEAFLRSKLTAIADGDATMLEWYRRLIEIRRQWCLGGQLSTANLSASWNAEAHVASLVYHTDSDLHFIVARLHPAGEFPKRIRLSGVQELILQNNCDAQQAEAQQAEYSTQESDWLLGEFGVAIGKASHSLKLDFT